MDKDEGGWTAPSIISCAAWNIKLSIASMCIGSIDAPGIAV
jgi:hypothetical protein